VFLCVVLSCGGRGLGAELIPRPRSSTKYLKGSIIKKKESDALKKGIRKNEKEEDGLGTSGGLL
jgi:hypothetical protein